MFWGVTEVAASRRHRQPDRRRREPRRRGQARPADGEALAREADRHFRVLRAARLPRAHLPGSRGAAENSAARSIPTARSTNPPTRERHVDFAVRWSHAVGPFDLGLSHFHWHRAREPRFVAPARRGQPPPPLRADRPDRPRPPGDPRQLAAQARGDPPRERGRGVRSRHLPASSTPSGASAAPAPTSAPSSSTCGTTATSSPPHRSRTTSSSAPGSPSTTCRVQRFWPARSSTTTSPPPSTSWRRARRFWLQLGARSGGAGLLGAGTGRSVLQTCAPTTTSRSACSGTSRCRPSPVCTGSPPQPADPCSSSSPASASGGSGG